MELSEITTTQAAEWGILPAYSRAQALLKLKAIIEAEPYDASTAEPAQEEFIRQSADAREAFGEAWNRISLAITLGWAIPDSVIPRLAARCDEIAPDQKEPTL